MIPAVEWAMDKDRQFRMIILSAADRLEELRACDIYRVLGEADDLGLGVEFRRWLQHRTGIMPLRTATELGRILKEEGAHE